MRVFSVYNLFKKQKNCNLTQFKYQKIYISKECNLHKEKHISIPFYMVNISFTEETLLRKYKHFFKEV